ncbi:MAG: S49 family peptidase [Leptolyngbya sp. SIO1D8]|nr:S49 family peptidase [Leptolyngbya sp. SIO1D8]
MHRLIRWFFSLTGVAVVGLGVTGCLPGLPKGEDKTEDEALTFTYVEGDEESENYLLEIRISGPILNSPSSAGFFGLDAGVTYAYQLQSLLKKVAEDDSVQGIFLRLSTPGGTVVGSNVLYEALIDYKEATENPIYAYIEGLSASGGVWSMVAADEIYAAPGSIVGSIGVIGPTLVYFDEPFAVDGGILGGGVTTRNGIQQFVISAGKGKDLGNPFRQPSEEELQVLRTSINNEYNNFVEHVAATRGISEQTLRQDMGAYIFDTTQAEQYNLIDGTLGRPEAIAALAEQLELGDDYQLVRISPEEPSLFEFLFGQVRTELTYEQRQAIVQADLCHLANYSLLAYHGDVLALCPTQYMTPQ